MYAFNEVLVTDTLPLTENPHTTILDPSLIYIKKDMLLQNLLWKYLHIKFLQKVDLKWVLFQE